MAAVTAKGVDHASPAAFENDRITAAARSPVVVENVKVGLDSVPVCSLYQQPTFIDPTPLPVGVVPSANSVSSVHPVTDAVIAKSFHEASRYIISPVVEPAGI